MRIHKAYAVLIFASVFVMCQKQQVKDPVVKVGKTVISKESFEGFKAIAGQYPSPLPSFFPGTRPPVTFMVECEAIYQAGKSRDLLDKINGGDDWSWKKRYVTSLLYFELFGDNLGFTDKELKDYYTANTSRFTVTSKTGEGKDTSYTPDFEGAKRQVADLLFYEKFKPDSQFIARIGEQANDSAALRNHWIYSARSNPPDFFLRQLYKTKFNSDLPDSLNQLVGEGKAISQRDMDVILTWVPEDRQEMRKEDLAKWLLKWKLFSEQAVSLGLTSQPKYNEMLHWASRINFASKYITEKVIPAIPKENVTDTTLALLAFYDKMGKVTSPSPERLTSELENIGKVRTSAKIDSAISALRNKVGITFMQSDWKDEKNEDPVKLIAQADSLREASSSGEINQAEATKLLNQAETLYRTLMNDFAFTSEGRRAHSEMAKLQIDKFLSRPQPENYLLASAVNYYRKGLMLDADKENNCNSYFMIGFTYDEHMKNFELAEANYKWILQNSPECALSGDAEFMMLHLDEPMTSIEEIQGQALRQGRKIDSEEDVETEQVVSNE